MIYRIGDERVMPGMPSEWKNHKQERITLNTRGEFGGVHRFFVDHRNLRFSGENIFQGARFTPGVFGLGCTLEPKWSSGEDVELTKRAEVWGIGLRQRLVIVDQAHNVRVLYHCNTSGWNLCEPAPMVVLQYVTHQGLSAVQKTEVTRVMHYVCALRPLVSSKYFDEIMGALQVHRQTATT